MKVLICNNAGKSAHYFQRLGIARALTACGHEAIIWDINIKSSHDAFDEFEPDIFIGQTESITPGIIDCLLERPYIKVALKASDWGSITSEASEKYPILKVNDEEIINIHKLKRENLINHLFIHYPQKYINKTHNFWKEELGLITYSDLNAADIFSFTNGVPQDKYKCDIIFMGGYWKYKAQVLNKWVLPLCVDFKYNIKIFGNSIWPCPQYCGYLPDGEEANALASAKICINLHEPHSQEYGWDIVERPFKIMSNKGFMITDKVDGLEACYPKSSFVSCSTPEEFFYEINSLLKNWDNHSLFLEQTRKRGFIETIDKHTYFDRIYDMFLRFGLTEEAENVIKCKSNMLNKLNIQYKIKENI